MPTAGELGAVDRGHGRDARVTVASVRNRPLGIVICLLVALALFLPGINWGLPSRAVDPFLFGDRPVWSGELIEKLAPPEDAQRGADVDANPIGDRASPVT